MMETIQGFEVLVLLSVMVFSALALGVVAVILGKTCWLLALELKKSYRLVASLSENPAGMLAAQQHAAADNPSREGIPPAVVGPRLAGS